MKAIVSLLALQVIFGAARLNAGEVKTENGYSVSVTFHTDRSVRVSKTLGEKSGKKSLSVISTPLKKQPQGSNQGDETVFKSGKLCVRVNKKNGLVTFLDANNKILLKEKSFSMKERTEGADKGACNISTTFALDEKEAIYGLGIMQEGLFNLRGLTRRNMIQGNTDDYVNIIHSIKGYALFWDNYSPTTFVDNSEGMRLSSDVGKEIDYYFMNGENADGVIAEIRSLTGSVPMQALWAYGFMQSRERYKSSKELLDVLHTYREQHIPLDVMIQDWQYWGDNYSWNAMEFGNPEFPDPQGMIDEVHRNNAKITISIWASFGPETKPYKELKSKNLLFDFETWPQSGLPDWPPRMDYPSGVRVYDAFSQEARDIYWNHLTRLKDMKIDGWWMDSTEPDRNNFRDEHMERITGLGSYRSVINAFPLMSVGGVYDNQRAVSNDKRVFILTRSVFAGQQRYGANTWSGDIRTSWNTLRNQIPAGLNFALTGNPNFNADIGGFFSDNYNDSYMDGSAPKNPLFQELYVRWMQYGAFTSMMRSHGTEVPREVYLYGKKGEPVYDALVGAIRTRYALLPYIYSTAWQVTSRNGTFQRALMMDFKDDERTWEIGNEFMFGNSILVAPVVRALYTNEKETKSRTLQGAAINWEEKKPYKVYLPKGVVWQDFYTGMRYNGGEDVVLSTSLNTIPLFVKSGSIIPEASDQVDYSTQKSWDDLTIRIYEGENGTFTLYEDEFDNYNYENGAYSTIEFNWNNFTKKLTIEKRKGSYKGMIDKRFFNLVLYRQDGTQKSTRVAYSGKAVSVRLL